MTKIPQLKFILIILVIGLFGCSNNDDDSDPTNPNNFYNGALTSATESNLLGIWAIFSAEYDGILVDIPVDYQECGRDFFIYSENNIYREYFYQSSGCDYVTSELNWDLEGGVLTLTNSLGQSDELVIISLSSNELKFKAKYDIDGDGALDVFVINARRYVPQEVDIVSPTFWSNNDGQFENLLSFTWDAYQGFYEFDKYEIYRSVGENCSKDNAVLIETITDLAITEYTDLTPPGEDVLCYFLKVYTSQGLLGESILLSVWTDTIYPTPVSMMEPVINNNTIELNWQASEMPYFSHYEIAFANHTGGTGSGFQEYTLAEITDRNVTSYTDENPPYLENPVYVIYVHNIFGNRTSFVNSDYTTYWELDFKREELVDFQNIETYAIDPDEPVVYLYGRESGDGNNYNIHRFNYEMNQTEAISNLSPGSSFSVPIKVITSTNNGKELLVAQGSDLFVYNASTLEYKYTLNTNFTVTGVDDFVYNQDLDYWILIDNDDVYTFTRDNANFTLVDSQPHFTEHQGTYNYQVFELNNNRLLVGHKNEPNSLVFDLMGNGTLTVAQNVDIPITDEGYYLNKTLYNSAQEFIINFDENRLYSTTSFSFLESFEEPYFPSGISNDGIFIYGSNNDPDWQISPESLHAKEAIFYDRNTSMISNYTTIGYPHVIFENYLGEIYSISSGLKKEGLDDNINNKGDVFLEKINTL